MRALILLSILCCLQPLKSQEWREAEWVTIHSERDSGWVKIPNRYWRSTSNIRLKLNQKGKRIKGDRVITIIAEKKDTLLKYGIYRGRYYRLIPLVKGEISLYKVLSFVSEHYFLERGGELYSLKKGKIQSTLTEYFPEEANDFLKKSNRYFYDEGLMRITKKLNNSIDEEVNWTYQRAEYKWRYNLGCYGGEAPGRIFSLPVDNKRLVHFQLGASRKVIKKLPQLSYELQLAYTSLKGEDVYRGRYRRKMKLDIINASGGIRLELLPKTDFSPYIFGGMGVSYPVKFVRQLDFIPGTMSFSGWPISQEIKASLPITSFKYIGIGVRIKASNNTTFQVTIRSAFFNHKIDLKESNPLFNFLELNGRTKTTFQSLQYGIIISRPIMLGL